MVKRYKYQALVALLPEEAHSAVPAAPRPALPGPACRIVVRAAGPPAHQDKMFSALITASDASPRAPDFDALVTMTVVGDDVVDYLSPGEPFTIWRGRDIGRGVVTRRIFV